MYDNHVLKISNNFYIDFVKQSMQNLRKNNYNDHVCFKFFEFFKIKPDPDPNHRSRMALTLSYIISDIDYVMSQI